MVEGKKQMRNHHDSEQTSPSISPIPTCPLTGQLYSHSNTPPHSHYSWGRKMEEFCAPLLLGNGTAPWLNLSSRAAASSAGAALSEFVGDCWGIVPQLVLRVHIHPIFTECLQLFSDEAIIFVCVCILLSIICILPTLLYSGPPSLCSVWRQGLYTAKTWLDQTLFCDYAAFPGRHFRHTVDFK